jgi:hypothetical protein
MSSPGLVMRLAFQEAAFAACKEHGSERRKFSRGAALFH